MPLTFSYQAQSGDGRAVSGTIDAPAIEQARAILESLRLQIIEIQPARPPRAATGISAVDLVAFNQQLAHLAAAGMPLEHGLRLIARDLERGRLASAVNQLAADLEAGIPLSDAFAKHAARFGPAYGRLIEAGIHTNNLPGMLLGLNRYLQTLTLLRSALWRAMAYPLAVFVVLCVVVAFILFSILPLFDIIYQDWGAKLPLPTQFLRKSGPTIGVTALMVAGIVVAAVALWKVLVALGRQEAMLDAVVLRLPLVGPVLRRSLVAQWCDAVRLGVIGGLDLPLAMRLAGDVSACGRLRRDAQTLATTIENGQPLDWDKKLSLMPASVPAAIEMASRTRGLSDTLATLCEMYQQQAQARTGNIPAILTPLLLLLLTAVVGFIVVAILMPLANMMRLFSF